MVERYFDNREGDMRDRGAEAADETRKAFLEGDYAAARAGVYEQLRALDVLQKLGFERRRAGQLIKSLDLPFSLDTDDDVVAETHEKNKHLSLQRLEVQVLEGEKEDDGANLEYFSQTTLSEHVSGITVFHYVDEEEPSIVARSIVIPRSLDNDGRGRYEVGTRQEQILYGLYEISNERSGFMYSEVRDVCREVYSDVLDKSSRAAQAANAYSNIDRVYLKLEDAFDPQTEMVQVHMATFLKSLAEHPLYGEMTLQDVMRVARREISFDEISEKYGSIEKIAQSFSSGVVDDKGKSSDEAGLLIDQKRFVRLDDIDDDTSGTGTGEGHDDGMDNESETGDIAWGEDGSGFVMGYDQEKNELDEDETTFSLRSDDVYLLATILSEDADITDRLNLRLSENDVIKLTSIVESFDVDDFEGVVELLDNGGVEERIGTFVTLFALYAESQNDVRLDAMIDCLDENRHEDARFVFSLLRRGVNGQEDVSTFLENVSEIF